MKLRIKRSGSTIVQVHELRVPRPYKLADGTTEIVITSPDGVATLHLAPREVEELVLYLRSSH